MAIIMSKEIRVTIRIPEYLKQKAETMAKDLSISTNDAIKVMLDAYKR